MCEGANEKGQAERCKRGDSTTNKRRNEAKRDITVFLYFSDSEKPISDTQRKFRIRWKKMSMNTSA